MIKRKLKPCVICGKPVYKIGAKVCSINCSLEYNLQHPEEVKNFVRELQKKRDRAEKKVLKQKFKTLTEYENEAKATFQKWVRFRDVDLNCISCTKTSNRYDAGHFFPSGVYSGLIFHPWNVNKQCSFYCNKMHSGNLIEYRIRLAKKYGEIAVKWLEDNKDRLRTYKYTKEQLTEINEFYKAKIKNNDFKNDFEFWQRVMFG
nr:recombination protein NinG [uncultured Flavobacterium sp.]